MDFDASLTKALYSAGGEEYSTLASLAYRQVLAAGKLVQNPIDNSTWYFLKEISSDGDISTVDVIFPASPFFLYFNSELLKMAIEPLLAYANNETSNDYPFNFSPHHLGTWPVANIEANQQENMPIEETGNLIMMISAISTIEKSTDFFYPHYWPLLQTWGEYLVSSLPDPGNQLCTDDFEGPTPHDANLAVKGIIGIDCFSLLMEYVGNSSGALYYHQIATKYANAWMQLANPNNTNHYRLRYDQPGWSLKYNLLYQQILTLHTFPKEVFDLELSFYDSEMNEYGVPLDDRHTFTKFDWESWVASMSPNQTQFENVISRLYAFADNTPDRVPLSDWYDTSTGHQTGFQARPVVGGLYAKMINDQNHNSEQ